MRYINVTTLRQLELPEKLVLMFLINEDNLTSSNNSIVATYKFLQVSLNMGKKAIQKAIKGLMEHNLLSKELTTVGWIYTINYDLLNEMLGLKFEEKEF